MLFGKGANEFTIEELDQLFGSDDEQETPPAVEETEGQDGVVKDLPEEQTDKTDKTGVEYTKAFSKRLKESTEKARAEERETIAKSLGYNSYDELQKSRENKVLEDNELDPEQVLPVVEKLVEQRINDDPRMRELEELRLQKIKDFGKRELEEITKLTGGEITKLSQLPNEVIELWKKEGSLKSAYLKLEGEKLINKVRSEQSKGSTAHLANPSGSAPGEDGKRLLNEQEKRIWKQFNPSMTEEELNKITVDK